MGSQAHSQTRQEILKQNRNVSNDPAHRVSTADARGSTLRQDQTHETSRMPSGSTSRTYCPKHLFEATPVVDGQKSAYKDNDKPTSTLS